MRKIITIIAVFALLASILAVSAAEDVYFIICKPGTYVCVRNSPKKGNNEGVRFDCGDDFISDGVEKNGFLRVLGVTEAGDGWVSLGHVVQDKPVIEKHQMRVNSNWPVISRNKINGRKTASLHNGDTLTVYARSDEWAVTNRGYVMTEYLEVDYE